MTLRSRLVFALLAAALIPTGIFTLFTLDQLDRAIGRWYRPGVDHALESALEVTKRSLTRLESLVLAQSNEWAVTWPSTALPNPRRAEIEAALRARGIDFLQVYRREGSAWSLADQLVSAGVIVPQEIALGSEIAAALAADHVIRSPRGALAAAAPLKDGRVLVTGIVMDPDFFAEAEQVATGMTHYRRLGVYVDVERRLVVLLVIGVVLLLVGLSLWLANRFAREIASPIGELSAALERVSSGDLATRVTPSGARELASLGESFNAMTARLAAAREALQRAEREAAWRDVARKLAHEFKNLLTPMQLSLQLLGERLEGLESSARESARQSLGIVVREVSHLGRLAEQFSQYARLPEPRFEPLDAAEVVRAASALLPEARIEVEAKTPVEVRGDRLLLSRALHNLLLNAVEAGPPGGPVEVRLENADGETRIEILDRGAGLPAGLERRLFEPYVSTKQRGSGLGLSLAQDIVKQHGGTLTLDNRTDGGGAVARIALPRERN